MVCPPNARMLHAFTVYAFVGLEEIIAKRLGQGGFGHLSVNLQPAEGTSECPYSAASRGRSLLRLAVEPPVRCGPSIPCP